jgi:hypothetical protein
MACDLGPAPIDAHHFPLLTGPKAALFGVVRRAYQHAWTYALALEEILGLRIPPTKASADGGRDEAIPLASRPLRALRCAHWPMSCKGTLPRRPSGLPPTWRWKGTPNESIGEVWLGLGPQTLIPATLAVMCGSSVKCGCVDARQPSTPKARSHWCADDVMIDFGICCAPLVRCQKSKTLSCAPEVIYICSAPIL